MNHRVVVSVITGIWLILGFVSQSAAISTAALQQGIPSMAPMLEQVTPAVVNIRVTKAMPTANSFLFNEEEIPDQLREQLRRLPNRPNIPAEPRQPMAMGAGSGVIVDAANGYIVTNHHVINGANQITVQLSDGRDIDAELLGSDANTDIALLQIEAENLVDIQLADIDTVQVGDYTVAIGNPFGIGQTVTSGIVSALGRTGLNNEHYEDFIQTDASINVGNSGGALIDMEGRLIGINTAIISGNGGSNGIGFAVPADMVAAVMQHLERDGEVRRGMLGVTVTNVTDNVASALDLDLGSGALVTSVLPDSAAELAGIQVSDVIVEIDNNAIAGSRELRNSIGLMSRDQQVAVALYRDGERLELDAVIGDSDGHIGGDAPQVSPAEFRGARLKSLEEGEDDFVDAGVVVSEVSRQSRSGLAGLRAGDVIVEVNRQAVDNLAAFNSAIESSDRFTALTVVREGRRLLVMVS